MIIVGNYNELKVSKKVDFGYYLEDDFGDEVLLPNSAIKGQEIKVGENLEVFIYRDSKDRLISTLKKPLLTVGEIAYLEVVSQSSIGAFVNIGLERDLFVPLKEQSFKLKEGKKYLFYMYVDKTDRLSGTTRID
jgi:predicted RNA-binding protein (virulence factor B family)